MKINKTVLFVVFTAIVVFIIYIFDYKAEEEKTEFEQALILNHESEDISYIQIIKPDIKTGIQKTGEVWALLEPIHDAADNNNIDELLKKLTKERQIAVVKQSQNDLTYEELKQFGLETPVIEFNFKYKSGQSSKITVGSIKNHEGNSYIRVNSENKIILASSAWFAQSQEDLIFYREKKLYRGSLASINKIRAKSLRDQFEIEFIDGKWQSSKAGVILDQSIVRETIKKISETNIIGYVFEGEPSSSLIKAKGLNEKQVYLELHTDKSFWSVIFSLRTEERALYALTERPTFLVKIEIPAWETFGNLNLDELRDRSSPLAFSAQEVHNIYYKNNGFELDITASDENWKSGTINNEKSLLNNEQISKVISHVQDLRISEFLNNPALKRNFEGKSMLIFKAENEKLVLQLNWGPSFKMKKDGIEKEYYYIRTHLSDDTFAIEKNLIDSLEFEKSAIKSSAVEVNANDKLAKKPEAKIE